ncbi:MAG: HD domain-containing protein [Butyrivibrio sp.]|nr:HD domain-containing protein [Butyrivibrio sp.]
MNMLKNITKRRLFRFILFLVMGIALNLIFNAFANHCLKKLLYLDTIGTIIVAIVGGYFPGVLVALITNVITFFTIPPSVYYVVLNIFIAITTTFFYNRFYKNKSKFALFILQYVILVSVCNSLFGSILNYIQGEGTIHNDGLIDNIILFFMQTLKCNFYIGHFIANLFINFIDKSICVGIAYFLIKIMPANVKNDIREMAWLQKPLTDDQISNINNKTSRRISVKAKIVLSLIISCFAITLVIAYMSRMLFLSYMEKEFESEAIGISRLVANTIETDRVDSYIKEGKNAPGYSKTEKMLYSIKLVSSSIQYIFVYKINDNGYTVIFDLDTAELKGLPPGTFIEFDKSVLPYTDKLKAGEEIEPFITDDEQIGYFLTSLSPVYDDTGKCICYAGTDISMDDYTNYEKEFMARLICLCAGFMITIVFAGIWFSEYHIIYPVNTLVNTANVFDYSDAQSRRENVDSIREIGIHTGDEIENLYYTFLQTIEENMVNYTYMLKQSQDLEEVQSKLIMVLADLVENRDASTGDHIRKTATYTGIIMYKMRELGYYTDVLTDEFISNVIKSAPLHDIGKIRISDSILNKPGKLTDEEFEIMKKHTIYGANVIDQCISSLTNADFLSEAKNIAAYHHEKWNGKGYPYGLSGEDIPLSARIMAVADVFDALISKRVYKDAFSFEKAMSIIKEDSGSHFDPKVAEAFLAASDQVRAAAEQFDRLKADEMIND